MVQKFTTTKKELPDIEEFLFKLWRKGVRIAPSFRPFKGFYRLAVELKGKGREKVWSRPLKPLKGLYRPAAKEPKEGGVER